MEAELNQEVEQEFEDQVEVEDQDFEDEDEDESSASEREGFVVASAGTTYGEKDPETGKKPKIEAEIEIEVGVDLTEMVELYDEKMVFEDAVRSVTRRGQNAVRSALNKHLDAGLDPAQIPDAVMNELADWRPDEDRRPTRKTPEENILSNFSNLPPEKQAEILARLQSAASQSE